MHPLYQKADGLSGKVIGAAIEVHRHKGSGLIESIYERCLLRELELRSIPATTQKIVRVEYKGLVFDEPLRFDLLVDNCLLLELKAVELLHPSSKAQLFSYMKLLDIPIGLLINFHEPVLKNGIFRMILPAAIRRKQAMIRKFRCRIRIERISFTLLSSVKALRLRTDCVYTLLPWTREIDNMTGPDLADPYRDFSG